MALGFQTFQFAGGAVQDLFASKGYGIEAGAYTQAAALARENAKFTEESTAVQEFQAKRKEFQVIGGQQSDVAAAGFAASGSALDLLRSSTSQAALTNEMVQQQGLITEAGYNEQASSYDAMAAAARNAQSGAEIGGILKGVAAVASVFL